ncbi:MAG TPA: GNAT family N-acetyltransferase [Thermoanaerobaculia bacterium]|nr:GNAT family N-acetyltransferase [Thermoanaerobaculia bacterium]
MSDLNYALSDPALSQRLERCEGKSNAAFVAARAKLQPEVGARSIQHAGAYVQFDGPGSPLTQSFALGIFETPTAEDMEVIESVAPAHEVSPLASMETIQLLVARGYHPIELTSVMHKPIGSSGSSVPRGSSEGMDAGFPEEPRGTRGTRGTPRYSLCARVAQPHEIDLWCDVATEGWSEFAELMPFVREMGRIAARSEGTTSFFAEVDGRAVGTGALAIHDGVALLAGASTIPSARRQGAQRALLETRLRYAAEQGCDLAMMCAAPGSASQRNAERQGFRIAYTRIKWAR